ncbi:hypothetical protein OG369_00775 [Streptomyces sp. NBC_01221]|uniref:hypothetical protein n=1 Tax=unclassified Streptomyces TaxID=2593676 RepID=UPI00224DCB49|nr:hypothetical protein [Streptomyces sp. NBC_01221]MCX4784784.1 hypothetical protein [Streptomyces sp. NBC_01221]WSP53414.1 hypothetical protein OG306_02590 [Streptomyces sp. NBC_01241]WSU25914.1 hypothetical protein OG508_36765 [Streptomyces sp. NBC_01108]
MIRLVVVDGEALLRSGFRLILNAADDIEVVATATGAGRRHRPRGAPGRRPVRHPDAGHRQPHNWKPAAPEFRAARTYSLLPKPVGMGITSVSGIIRSSRWKDTEPDQPARLVPTLAVGRGALVAQGLSHAMRVYAPQPLRAELDVHPRSSPDLVSGARDAAAPRRFEMLSDGG